MSPVDLAILHGLYSIASYLYGRINEKRLK